MLRFYCILLQHCETTTLLFVIDLNQTVSVSLEFSVGSFCSIVDVSNFSRLRTLRLDGNDISRLDIPSESALCLRQASVIEV